MTRTPILSRLRSDRRATTALIFGLSVLPLATMGAFAIDITSAVSVRSRLKIAADAALLTTTQSAIAIFRSPSYTSATSFSPAVSDGHARYKAQAGVLSNLGTHTVPTINVSHSGGSFTTTIDYQGTYSTIFPGLLDHFIPIGGHSEMSISVVNYVDIHLLMDVSESMMVGGDATEQGKLVSAITGNNTFQAPTDWGWSTNGCAFACHWDAGNNDFYQLSRDRNITLRIDQLKSAATAMAGLLQSKNVNNWYRLGLFTFSTDGASQYTGYNWEQSWPQQAYYTTAPVNYPLVGDGAPSQVSDLIPIIQNVPPTLADPWHAYNTDITGSVTDFATNILTTGGDGSAPNKPRKFVILMTDGLDDHICQGSVTDLGYTFTCDGSNRIQVPVQASACDALRAKGAVVGVIQTALFPQPGNVEYTNAQTIATSNLKNNCASPGMYFAVDDQASINAAMLKLLNSATVNVARFSQ